jgi:hypothetical protein
VLNFDLEESNNVFEIDSQGVKLSDKRNHKLCNKLQCFHYTILNSRTSFIDGRNFKSIQVNALSLDKSKTASPYAPNVNSSLFIYIPLWRPEEFRKFVGGDFDCIIEKKVAKTDDIMCLLDEYAKVVTQNIKISDLFGIIPRYLFSPENIVTQLVTTVFDKVRDGNETIDMNRLDKLNEFGAGGSVYHLVPEDSFLSYKIVLGSPLLNKIVNFEMGKKTKEQLVHLFFEAQKHSHYTFTRFEDLISYVLLEKASNKFAVKKLCGSDPLFSFTNFALNHRERTNPYWNYTDLKFNVLYLPPQNEEASCDCFAFVNSDDNYYLLSIQVTTSNRHSVFRSGLDALLEMLNKKVCIENVLVDTTNVSVYHIFITLASNLASFTVSNGNANCYSFQDLKNRNINLFVLGYEVKE